MNIKELEKIKTVMNGQIGKPVKTFFIEHLRDMKNIDNVKECSKAQDQAIEFKAQIKAYEKMVTIFDEIMTITGEMLEEDNDNEYNVQRTLTIE